MSFDPFHSFARLVAMSALLSVPIGGLFAETPQEKEADGQAQKRTQRLAQMHAIAEDIRIFSMDEDDQQTEAARVAKPLFRLSNEPRLHNDGTLWAWGDQGRPVAFLELFLHDNSFWVNALTSTSLGRLSAERAGRRIWNPQTAGIELKLVPKYAPPSAKKLTRLRQILMFVQGFAAHQFWEPNNTRYDLTLHAEPIHRYKDAQAGLIDGAAFLFTQNNEPEIILLMEAHQTEDEKLSWWYALATIGSAEMHVTLDGEEVWTCPRAFRKVGRSSASYYLYTQPLQD